MKYMAPGDPVSFPQQDDAATIPGGVAGMSASTPTTTTTTDTTTTTIVGSGDKTSKPRGNKRAVVATIFGLLLLVGAVGAGLVLVSKPAILKQNAAGASCTSLGILDGTPCGTAVIPGQNKYTCSAGEGLAGSCQSDNGNRTITIGCTYQTNAVVPAGGCNCVYVYSGSDANTCTSSGTCNTHQIEGVCPGGGNPPPGGGNGGNGGTGGGGTCGSCTNTAALNGACGGIGQWCIQDANGGCHLDSCACGNVGCSGPTPKPLAQCGVACNSSADCKATGANGGPEGCVADPTTGVKTCQNLLCPAGHTIPGANCDCNVAGRTCGQTCNASVGLCDATSNSTCTFVSGAACTGNSGSNVQTYCVPNSIYANQSTAPSGWSTAQCSAASGEGANRYVLFNGANPTQAQIQQTCLTPTASPAPSPSPTPAPSSCTNVRIYDTSWNQLTPAQLSALTPGTQVYFTVMGTTSGTIDRARFVINGTVTPEVTSQKPGSAGEFDYLYSIPSGTTTFTIIGQLHDSVSGQWF